MANRAQNHGLASLATEGQGSRSSDVYGRSRGLMRVKGADGDACVRAAKPSNLRAAVLWIGRK